MYKKKKKKYTRNKMYRLFVSTPQNEEKKAGRGIKKKSMKQ